MLHVVRVNLTSPGHLEFPFFKNFIILAPLGMQWRLKSLNQVHVDSRNSNSLGHAR
jgi:hypothetical protein